MTARLWLLLCCVCTGAHAAGFYFGENGIKALSQGGAFAGSADDLSAIQHNPAGLAQQTGFGVLVDGQLLTHGISFLRRDANASSTLAEEASNQGGPFVLPMAAVSYALPWEVTLAAGIYGPPAVGRYRFPEPDYSGSGVSSPALLAPQRYTLIEKETIVAFPTLSVGWQVTPWLAVGGSLQYAYARLRVRQAITSKLVETRTLREEASCEGLCDTDFDSLVTVNLNGRPTLTGILGIMVRPWERLSFGASLRPGVSISTSGPMALALGKAATQGDFRVSENPTAALELTLPLELKIGVAYRPVQRVELVADCVFQDWSAFNEVVVRPQDVTLQQGAGAPRPLADVRQPKGFQDSYSVRAGGSYAFDLGVTLRGGVLFETTAMPDAYSSVDFFHPTRILLTGGVGYRFKSLELITAVAYSPPVTRDVNSSVLRAANTNSDAGILGPIVGNGRYTSSGWIASLGLRARLGDQPSASKEQHSPR